MLLKIIILSLVTKIFCLYFPENLTELINELNVTNLTEIAKNIKKYENDYMSLYMKASRKNELLCDKMEKNIQSLLDIKNKYIKSSDIIDSGIMDNSDIRQFLELRGDIQFGIRNIEIIIKKLNKSKIYCFNTTSQMENYLEERKKKNKKSQEEILRTINQIININEDL